MKCVCATVITSAFYCCLHRGFEHGVKSQFNVFDNVLREQLPREDIVLDGEMIIYNKTKCVRVCVCVCVHGGWREDDIQQVKTRVCTHVCVCVLDGEMTMYDSFFVWSWVKR